MKVHGWLGLIQASIRRSRHARTVAGLKPRRVSRPLGELLESRVLLSANPLLSPHDLPLMPGAIRQADVDEVLATLTTTGRSDVLNYLFTAQSGPLINVDDYRADPRFSASDGTGFAVVILDTGIDLNHPYFGPDADSNGVSDRIVYSFDFSGANDSNASDTHGHGSNVTSIATSSDTTHRGMAPAASIIHLKVFPDGPNPGASDADIEEALQWAVANAATYNIASVNLSLGSANVGYHNNGLAYSDEFAALAALDVLVSVAAGNSYANVQGLNHIAADPSVIAVGAVYDANIGSVSYSGSTANTTAPDRITPFSQRDEFLLDIFAPGAPITGANQSGGTNTQHGTSQAAPHIAGIAALAQDLAADVLGRRLTLDEFESLLRSSGAIINDGDDENDTVTNTGLNFPRVDVFALGEAILDLVPGSISGRVFDDANTNGTDNGEPGLAAWTVFLDSNANGTVDSGSTTVVAGGVPLSIVNVDTRRALHTVSNVPGLITDVNVQLNITHTFDGDVQVWLVSPQGTRIELFSDVGGSADNFANTILDDEAATAITAGSAPFANSFRPEELLSKLDGENPNGQWFLEISDDAGSNVGTLTSWSLTLAYAETSQLSAANGSYTFADLPAGLYEVRQVDQSGWVQTAPAAPGYFTLDVSPGEDLTNADFGNTQSSSNQNPVITSSDTPSVPENTTAVLTVTATDADLPAQTITFSITGGADQALFSLTIGGDLAFFTAPDFEIPTDADLDNVYVVQVTAADGAGGTAAQTLSVTVTDVVEQSTDIRVLSATTNGTTTLTVSYDIDSLAAPAFDLGFYRSNDLLFGGDTQLRVFTLSAPADLSVGSHVKTWTIGSGALQVPLPGAGTTEPTIDYYLLAVADPLDQVSEADTAGLSEDNLIALSGVYHLPSSLVLIQGGAGVDTISTTGSVTVTFNGTPYTYTLADVTGIRVRSHAGADVMGLATFTKAVLAFGGDDADQLTGGTAADTLWGGAGADTLNGGGGNDSLTGEAGDDSLVGGAGGDTYSFNVDLALGSDALVEIASGGTDTLDFSSTLATAVTVNLASAAAQTVSGNGNLVLTLSSATQFENLTGGAQGDALLGNTLANILIGGNGNDTLTGGTGNDQYSFDTDSALGQDTLVEALAAGTDTLTFAATTTQAVTVNLSLAGSQTVSGNLSINLGAGDRFDGLTGGSLADTLTGNALANTLIGGPGNDTLSGAAGNDLYSFDSDAALGTDTLVELAGQGTDTLDFVLTTTKTVVVNLLTTTAQVVNSNLTVVLGAADVFDNVTGGSLADNLTGNTLSNTLQGGAGGDTLSGGDGGDSLIGGAGNDSLVGGNGDDTYGFDADSALGTDTVVEALGQGNDLLDFGQTTTLGVTLDLASTAAQTVVSGKLTLILSSASGIEMVIGTAKNDTLNGNALNNVLFGGAGVDVLRGFAGRDLLVGGNGADSLYGGDEDDLVLGGLLTYYNETTKVLNRLAIDAVMAEWVRTDADYATRISNLRSGGGLNGSFTLDGITSLTDGGAVDALFGEAGLDWFWKFGSDTTGDLNTGGPETVN